MPTQGDFKQGDLGATETTETDLGDITIPASGISRIIGVYGQVMIETGTAGEGSLGEFRLSFSTVAGTFKFPAQVFNGPAGTLADQGAGFDPKIIPVNISVPSNEVVGCFARLNQVQTGDVHGMVGVIME